MAYIKRFRTGSQGRQRRQEEAIEGEIVPLEFDGSKFLQITSLGSSARQERGKQSQNLRLDREAFEQLIEVGRKHFESN